MQDYDFVNEDFFNMWKQRTKKGQEDAAGSGRSGREEEDDFGEDEEDALGFNGKHVKLSVSLQLRDVLFGPEIQS